MIRSMADHSPWRLHSVALRSGTLSSEEAASKTYHLTRRLGYSYIRLKSAL